MKPYYTGDLVTLWNADALELPLPDASVDLVVTSPPYFALRSYTDGGQHYAGQIGSEPTPGEFLDALIAATREMVRVIKPTGSIFVNLGDKYATRSAGLAKSEGQVGARAAAREANPRRPPAFPVARDQARPGAVRDKSLMALPQRYMIRCIDELGLILRAEIIWDKPNGLPESVTDRVRRSHEQWFHFTKSPRYFSAVDEIREGYAPGTATRYAAGYRPSAREAAEISKGYSKADGGPSETNPLGKLPGSVWEIPTQPLIIPEHISHRFCCDGVKRDGCKDGIDHFAAFPMEWPRRIIQGWSPVGICTECGEGRRPVVEKRMEPDAQGRVGLHGGARASSALAGPARAMLNGLSVRAITGERCGCPEPAAPTTPAVVLDPFGGTGTTALVASVLGRHGHSVDLSTDYCWLARWRVTDPGQRAAAAQVDKPDPIPAEQPDLFGETA